MKRLVILFVALARSWAAPPPDSAPVLQWVKTAGGSGMNSSAAAAVDSTGNLYVVGSTSSLDFPGTGAANSGSGDAIATTDVFAMKLDNNGNIVYSTRFGGSNSDQAVALAVGADGSLYLAGSTNSTDFPVTAGAYMTKPPVSMVPNPQFICKLNAAGSIEWATYFPASNITSIAVDLNGNPFVAGSSHGGLPTTPGAYVTNFTQYVGSNGFFAVVGPTSAFVTKLNAQGSGLIYSTYVPTDNASNTVQQATALAVDSAGSAWFGVGGPPATVPLSGIPPAVVELNPLGSAIVASAVKAGMGNAAALAFDAFGNVYIAGSYMPQTPAFPATQGAFQPAPRPSVPVLPYQPVAGGGLDAFVAKWDHSLTHLLAATLLGGESEDAASSIAVDTSGNVIVGGYTNSKAFPTHLPFQESFSSRAGFVAGFDPTLSELLFSTYLGDTSPFVANAALPDGNGNVFVAGSTVISSPSLVQGESGPGNRVIANKIALRPVPEVQLDSVQNYASHIAWALAPSEPISALGSGFAQDAQIVVDGVALAPISVSQSAITALLPSSLNTSASHTVQISSSGAVSNAVLVPGAIASPGIYTASGSGLGEAFVVNDDHTRNSPVNPAVPGSAVTIYIAGQGDFTMSQGYAVLPQPPAVFIDEFYCNGIAAKVGPVHGLPGNVYQLSVFVPDVMTITRANPDLKNFTFPAQSPIQVWMGPPNAPILSQTGVFINVK